MNLGVGDVASQCGPNPCGLWDYVNPSPECDAWQVCAAAQNAPVTVASTGCVVGGVDANGDTIINCPQMPPCLMGSGPLQTGQTYCAGVLDAAQLASAQYFAQQTATANGGGLPSWLIPAVAVFAVVLIAGRR